MEKNDITSKCKVLIIGGSAGSLDVLMKVIPKLRLISSFSIVIVLHRKSAEDSTLEELIAIKTDIPVQILEDKVELLPGFIYVAPSDYHLLFEKNGILSLDASEKINYSRPSIDVAFESASEAYADSVTAILLSGANADGTAGLNSIQAMGGTSIVQDPETATMPFMPKNAIENSKPNYVFSIKELLDYINQIESNNLQIKQ